MPYTLIIETLHPHFCDSTSLLYPLRLITLLNSVVDTRDVCSYAVCIVMPSDDAKAIKQTL